MASNNSLDALNRLTELEIPYSQIEAFCRRWQVSELALFGSVLREDFNSQSDVDILISFPPEAPWSLFDLVVMKTELEAIFSRNVDLVERDALRNPYRRKSIFSEMKTIYATR